MENPKVRKKRQAVDKKKHNTTMYTSKHIRLSKSIQTPSIPKSK